MKNWGIRSRVLLLVLLPAIAIAAALSGYTIYILFGDLDRDLHSFGRGIGRQLASIAEFSTYSGDRQALRRIAVAALDETNVTNVEFYDIAGDPLAASGALPRPLEHLPPTDRAELISSDIDHLVFSAPILRHLEEIDDPFLLDSPSNKTPLSPPLLGWVSLEISKKALDARKHEVTTFILSAFSLSVVLAVLIASWLARQLVSPIERLQHAVSRIRSGDLSPTVPTDSGGEVQALEEGFNAMATALRESHSTMETRIRIATAELAEKKEDAERANVAKSRFLAAASHDLRQPMHALSLFVSDLIKTADTPQTTRLAERIHASLTAMSELLSTLLDISRLDVAGIKPEPRPLPLTAMFSRLEQSFARAAADKGLWLKVRPAQIWIYSDPALLERLISNLIANAIQYTDHGGILIAARLRHNRVLIEIRDSGLGIPKEYQEAIFEEFFQVANPERESRKGLGLGLAIVSRLARALQTTIKVRSCPGHGTTFTIDVLRSDSRLAAAPPASLPGSSGPLVALLDEHNELPQVATWINAWGYRCQRVTSLDAARIACANGAVAVIADEIEKLQQILGQNGLNTPAILLGNASPKEHALWHHLPLPPKPAKLRALLQQLAGPATV